MAFHRVVNRLDSKEIASIVSILFPPRLHQIPIDYIFDDLKYGIFVTIGFRAGISSMPFEYFHYRLFASLQYRRRAARKYKKIARKFFFDIVGVWKMHPSHFLVKKKKKKNGDKIILHERVARGYDFLK